MTWGPHPSATQGAGAGSGCGASGPAGPKGQAGWAAGARLLARQAAACWPEGGPRVRAAAKLAEVLGCAGRWAGWGKG
jgi:hypothetical protein